jgi:hypothetical protein
MDASTKRKHLKEFQDAAREIELSEAGIKLLEIWVLRMGHKSSSSS